jgi:predicted transcriptional regulator
VKEATAYIGRSLAQQRERLGLTQAELARRMGTTQAWIAQMETGKREPRWSTLQDFARALELEPMLIPRSRVSAVEAFLQHQTDLPIEAPPLAGDRW